MCAEWEVVGGGEWWGGCCLGESAAEVEEGVFVDGVVAGGGEQGGQQCRVVLCGGCLRGCLGVEADEVGALRAEAGGCVAVVTEDEAILCTVETVRSLGVAGAGSVARRS